MKRVKPAVNYNDMGQPVGAPERFSLPLTRQIAKQLQEEAHKRQTSNTVEAQSPNQPAPAGETAP